MKSSVFNIIIFPLFLVLLFFIVNTPYKHSVLYAATTGSLQGQINTHQSEINDLNKKIAEYQTELTKVGADKKTLQNAIDGLNLERKKIETQVSVIQHQINTTQLQIEQIGLNITDTEQSIKVSQAALKEDIQNLQQTDSQPLIIQILSSKDFSEAWKDIDIILQLQTAIQQKVHDLENHKKALSQSQQTSKQKQTSLVSQKSSLTSKQNSLTQTKSQKDRLLTETDAEETKYEKLLAAAKAQIVSFSTFTQSAGGSGLLSNQTSCDSWGCYYNQRDAAWGNTALNGTKYRLASDGCLITAMAMVMTHYGYTSVTPALINADPGNFAAYYPAYLLYTVSAGGGTATRKTTTIDAVLTSGNPVIVGLNAYGGTHFVVLISGSNGNYIMRDPYIANGKDINFTDHYSINDIYEINKVIIS